MSPSSQDELIERERDCREPLRARRCSSCAASRLAGQGTEIGIEDVSLTPRPVGEILGVAGVDGNGQRALAEVIAGQRHATRGEIRALRRADRPAVRRRPAEARPALRHRRPARRGHRARAAASASISSSSGSASGRSGGTAGSSAARRSTSAPRSSCESFDVRTPGVATRAGTLSGGNIQKVILARELSLRPQGRRVPQADIRARREDDEDRARHDPRARRRRWRRARHLHRPRRAARDLRPDRRALPRAPRRRARQRSGRRASDRRADGGRREEAAAA